MAMIVRHDPGRPFTTSVNIKATTYGGVAVKGKKGSRITFNPPKKGHGLRRGSIQVGSQFWAPRQEAESGGNDLSSVYLQSETHMQEKLLGQQAPGGGPGIKLGVSAGPYFDSISGG